MGVFQALRALICFAIGAYIAQMLHKYCTVFPLSSGPQRPSRESRESHAKVVYVTNTCFKDGHPPLTYYGYGPCGVRSVRTLLLDLNHETNCKD